MRYVFVRRAPYHERWKMVEGETPKRLDGRSRRTGYVPKSIIYNIKKQIEREKKWKPV